jgi:NAD(P)-dependent dehydrogenase (short-subunit alcohol dehydrogenase family)
MADPQTDRVAVVTGAARGIGLAIGRRFAALGWRVALLDIDAATLGPASASLDAEWPSSSLALVGDVRDPSGMQQAMARIEASLGRIDALVNNAGVAVFKPVAETSFDDWRLVLSTNLDGPFLCSQAALPALRRAGGGSIVNIASISGLRASTLRVAYGTSKAALIHLTRQQAVELASYGIRCNAVAPGPVETAMARQVHTPEIRADYHATIPLARYGLEEEIAAAVTFLCSAEAAYITGQVLAVDGGFDAAGVGLAAWRRMAG